MVHTVTGALPAQQLGHCQMHEHLFVADGPAAKENPALRIDDPECSLKELEDYRRGGGGSCLDAQPGGAGRNAKVLRRISERSGVPIIAVTGYHLQTFYPPTHWMRFAERDELTEFFCRELTEGCEEAPDVLPGAVKAAIGGEELQGAELERLCAAATAAAHHQVPLILHTDRGRNGVQAVEAALRCGVPAHRVVVCHADRQAKDFSIHEAIADAGVMLEYDTIGRFKYHDDASEIRLIEHMLARGHESQLLLSLDTTRERLKRYGGAIGLTYLLEQFLPMLAQEVSQNVLQTIMIQNPRRVFE